MLSKNLNLRFNQHLRKNKKMTNLTLINRCRVKNKKKNSQAPITTWLKKKSNKRKCNCNRMFFSNKYSPIINRFQLLKRCRMMKTLSCQKNRTHQFRVPTTCKPKTASYKPLTDNNKSSLRFNSNRMKQHRMKSCMKIFPMKVKASISHLQANPIK